MPAAAPATSRVLRSAALSWKHWANSEPMAPPVMMIGPSAPNGPPLPMEIAEDSGLSTATLGDMRLPPIRIASMASGMPWPRIFSEPNRAIRPMISPPSTGATTIHRFRGAWASGAMVKATRWNQTRFSVRPISRSRSQAARLPPVPTATAIAASISRRRSAVKSAKGRPRICPPGARCVIGGPILSIWRAGYMS